MKTLKNISIALLAGLTLFLSSCEKREPGGTAVEELCGQWIAYSPDFDFDFTLFTSNTSDNKDDKLLITDKGDFWEFTVESNCNTKNKTFSVENATNKFFDESAGEFYDILITIRNGKITEKAVELPSGTKADKIEFEIWFEDIASAGAPADYFVTIVGYRRSGFLEDESYIYYGDEEPSEAPRHSLPAKKANN